MPTCWQTVERKARFINQVMRGRLDVREIEDIGDNALSFAEVKALASGDPLILEKAHVDAEVDPLQPPRARVAAQPPRAARHDRRRRASAPAPASGRSPRSTGALPRAQRHPRRAVRDHHRRATRYAHRTDAAGAARALGRGPHARGPATPVAQLGGLQIDGDRARRPRPAERYLHLTLHGLPEHARHAQTLAQLARQPACR